MAYVAIERLRWGDVDIEPGQPVPEDEPGRNYPSLLLHGQIAEVSTSTEATEAFEQAVADRDEAVKAAEAVDKLRLEQGARAERLEKELGEAIARAETAEGERDALALQVEELTAPAPAAKTAAKKPAAKK